MGNQKSAFRRYCIIDRCLNQSTKKYWLKTELLTALEAYDISISPDMLDKDIYDMRNETGLIFQNAPIVYSRKPKGYCYTRKFSIVMPFDEEDIKLLTKAAQTLNQFKDISYFDQFAGAVDKVVRLIKLTKDTQLGDGKPYILFEKVPYLRGYEHLDVIIEAIEAKNCLMISYQKFGRDQASQLTLCPYFVKEFHNRWYVIGYNPGMAEIRTYALDRIVSLSGSHETFSENTWIDPESYFRDCIGINLASNKTEKVLLSFKPGQGEYIKTQSIHRSQQIVADNDQELRVQLEIIINHELVMTILSYGANVKVIEPKELAQQIAEAATAMTELYK